MTPTCGSPVTSDAVAFLVKASPTAAAITPKSFCAGSTSTAIALVGTPTGVTFNVSGGAALGLANQTGVTSIPAFSITQGVATITVTPQFDGCPGTPVTFSLTGAALPNVFSITPAAPQICSV